MSQVTYSQQALLPAPGSGFGQMNIDRKGHRWSALKYVLHLALSIVGCTVVLRLFHVDCRIHVGIGDQDFGISNLLLATVASCALPGY